MQNKFIFGFMMYKDDLNYRIIVKHIQRINENFINKEWLLT